MDADCHAFCQAIYKGIEGSEWEELYFHYRDLSKAAGAKKKKNKRESKSKSSVGQEGSPKTAVMISVIQHAKTTFWEEIRLGKSCGESTSQTLLKPWKKL